MKLACNCAHFGTHIDLFEHLIFFLKMQQKSFLLK